VRGFRVLLEGAEPTVLGYGFAILESNARRAGPWFFQRRRDLLEIANEVLFLHWPIEEMREFTIARFDRLLRVKRVARSWGEKIPAALFGSLRHSTDPKHRMLLDDFIRRAHGPIRVLAESIRRYGIRGRTYEKR